MNKLEAVLGVSVLIGSTGSATHAQQSRAPAQAGDTRAASEAKDTLHEVYGKIVSINEDRVTLETRTGNEVDVDAAEAREAHMCVPLVVGHAVGAKGTRDAKGVLHATTILRAKDSPKLWPVDR